MTVIEQALRPYVPTSLLAWDALFDDSFGAIDGSAISVDIVGFTALSESLAAMGRRGAEELVGLVNDVFARLIAIADHAGADILTFGGDAMTMLTRGDGHAQRAVAAASAMREVLAAPVAPPSLDPVQLSMSTGVHSGEVWLFAVEGQHRDVVVTGTGITQTLRAEGAAGAGDILVTSSTAALLPDGWLGAAVEATDGGVLHHGQPPAGDATLLGPATAFAPACTGVGVPAVAHVPPGQRGLLATGGVIGEHRLTSIGFLAIKGLDGLIDEVGPPDVHQRLQQLMGVLAGALQETGVHWLQTDTSPDGAKFLLAAGAPTSTGQDERAMLQCMQRVVEADLPLDLRMGVNRGRTFTGSVGSPTSRRTYAAMGDTTNLAARLMGKAGTGAVMTTRSVVATAGAGVYADAVEPFRVKGKSRPVEGMLLRRVERAEGTETVAPTDLLGRTAELAVLNRLAMQAERGEGQAVTISGDPGIGKSTLLDSFLARRGDVPVHAVGVQRYDTVQPFLAVRLLLQRLLPQVGGPDVAGYLEHWLGDDRRLAPLLGPILGLELDATQESAAVAPSYWLARTAQLVLHLLAQTITTPTVLVVEDLQWADDASREILAALSRGIGTTSMLLVATSRPSGDPLPGSQVLALTGLGLDAARELARSLDADLPDRMLQQVLDRADGNPLFVRELLLSVIDDGAELPDSVEAVITARLDLLAPEDRLALCDASVLGSAVDLDMVAGVREQPLPGGWLDRVADFVSPLPSGELTFSHDLYRTAAYGALAFGRRAMLHRRVGRTLERDGADDALLALHFHRGEDPEPAWRYGTRAGLAAMQAHAAADAVALLVSALSHASAVGVDDATLAEVMDACGDVSELSGFLQEAKDRFDEALELLPGDDAAGARLNRKSGLLEIRLGNIPAAKERYEVGIQRAKRVEDPKVSAALHAAIHVGSAGIAYREGRYADGATLALAACHDAITGADRRQLAHGFQLLDLCQQAQGLTPEYAGWAAPAFAAAGDLVGEGNALNNEGIAAYYAGRWHEALDRYRASLDVRMQAGDVLGQAMSANNIGEVLSDQGHLAEAEAMFKAARRDWGAIGYTIGEAIATSNLARVAIRRGDVDSARRDLTEVLSSFEAIDAAQFVIETHGRLAEAALVDGAPTEALLELGRSAAGLEAGSQPAVEVWLQRLQGWAVLQDGRAEAGRQVLAAAREAAIEHDVAYELMWIAALSGDTAVRDEIADRLQVTAIPDPG